MEERIIDDEYGRGIRLKKTKDGYVDVTDELAEKPQADETDAPETDEDFGEVAFEFPDLGEDDEDLVNLSPEEALALRKKKEEEEKARIAEYNRCLEEGEKLLESGSFHAAELKYEKALTLDNEAVEATVGYWRAKTADFSEPDVLMSEYVEAGFENLEGDLGYKAVDILKNKYPKVFKARLAALEKQAEPLQKTVEEKRASRREIIAERLTKSAWKFSISTAIAIILFVVTLIFGSKIFSTKEAVHLLPTIIVGAAFVVALIVSLVFTNKFLNVLRIHRANERDESTEEGRKLVELRDYIELYARFTENVTAEENEE